MTRNRGHRNSNERGNTMQRHARKLFLLNKFGNGRIALCHECRRPVCIHSIFVDRIIPARNGTYASDNIRPHCGRCSGRQGATATNEVRRATA